jgi:hypothetical protein
MSDQVVSSERIGVLVIHGIGEQAPYQTLDNFARGLASALRKKLCDYSLRFDPINRKDGSNVWTEARVQLEPETQPPNNHSEAQETSAQPRPSITVAEYYWSPKAEDQISWKDTLRWLAISDLSPISHMTVNIREIWQDATSTGVNRLSKAKAASMAVGILTKEIFRTLVLYLPLPFILYGIFQWLGDGVEEVFKPVRSYQFLIDNFLNLRHILLGALAVGVLTLGAFLFTETVPNLWRKATQGSNDPILRAKNDMVRFSRRIWIITAGALLILFAGCFLFVWIELKGGLWSDHILHWLVLQPKLPSPWIDLLALAQTGIAALAAIVLRNFLANYMGKVAIYVTTDANSKNYAIRGAILQGSCNALNNFLNTGTDEPPYDRVYIAAHSLGTVIALDTINEMLSRAHTDATLRDQLSKKLCGLMTFGSPLNKVWYFFRQQTDADESVRAQILSKLHAFRRVSSHRDYSPYDLLPRTTLSKGPENPPPANPKFLWINMIATMDVVTGPLRFDPAAKTVAAAPPTSGSLKPFPSRFGFYWVDRQYKGKWTRYWKPVMAHTTYWDDPCLYERFLADFNI